MTASSPRPSRHWVFTAAVAPLGWIALILYSVYSPRVETCLAAHPEEALGGPCAPGDWIIWLCSGVILSMLAMIPFGLLVGITEGNRRYRFACGRRIPAIVVGIGAPWAMAAYALGFGIGRFFPAPKPKPKPHEAVYANAWQAAVSLYADLNAGRPAPNVIAPGFLGPGPVRLDMPFIYARYHGMDVTYQGGGVAAVGSPSFVAGAVAANLLANSIGRAHAAQLARTQWRGHRTARVVVTDTTTWCAVDGRWLAFDHHAVMEYYLDGSTCVLTFAGVEPLMLSGPPAACHAVLFAYLRHGAGWQGMPFLHQISAAAAALPR